MYVSLTVEFTRTQLTISTDLCWKLTATVTAASEISNKIFIMHRIPEAAGESNYTDGFEAVADAQDLDRIPEDAPDLANEMPYYRVSSVELLFKDVTTLEETRAELKTIIQNTVDEVKAVAAALDTETEVFE